MITEEKINQMHSRAIDVEELTTKELKEMGFTSNDLTDLVKSGRIVRVKIGHYIVPAKELHDYGKKLLKSREYDKAYQCFVRCNKLEPNNMSTLLQLFLQSINRKNYEDAFKYFDGIYFNDNCVENNRADNCLYLYLLSCITDVPDKYQALLDTLSIDDITLKKQTSMYPDLERTNNMRKSILEHKFKPSLNFIQTMTRERKFSSVREMILKELLFQANKEKDNFYSSLNSYINNKDYESVVLVLEAEKDIHPLPLNLEYLLFLALDYIEIKNTEKVPDKPNFNINNTFNAISHRDYKRALELIIRHSETNSIPLNNQILYRALVDINELIDSLTIKIEGDNQLVLSGFEKKIITEGEQLQIPKFDEKEITYADVISALIGNKIEAAEDVLNKFFEQKGIVKYRYIIDNLLAISTLENDLSYSKAMIELANMSNPNYKLDMSSYIQDFYISLNAGEYDVAHHYLVIVECSNELVTNKINVNVLKDTLTTKQQKKEEPEEIIIPEPKKVTITEQKTVFQPKPVVNDNSDTDVSLVKSKIEIFETGEDIVVLKAMDSTRRKKIHGIVASMPSVKSFSIGSGSTRRIVLMNSPYLEARIDKRATAIEGDKAYREQDYERCIACYRKLLYVARPNPNIYAKLGLAYMKKNQLKKAVEYLTISTELSKEIDGTFDFTELIAKLTGKAPQQEEAKPKFQMREEEFTTEENYYGVQYIAEVSQLVFAEGMSLEEACRKFNYDLNQMNVIRLIYAEEYYSAGDYDAGDKLVKTVNSSKNKSKRVKSILERVIARKKFYKNRPKEKEQSFVYMYK